MSNWEEPPGQTQNMLEGLCIPSGLGILWDPPGSTGSDRGKDIMIGLLFCAATANQGQKTDGLIPKLKIF